MIKFSEILAREGMEVGADRSPPSGPSARPANDDSQAEPIAMAPLPDNELWDRIRICAVDDPELNKRLKGHFSDVEDRSRVAMDIGGALKRAGFTQEEMDQALHEFEPTRDWALEKGDANDGRELQRVWDHAGERKEMDGEAATAGLKVQALPPVEQPGAKAQRHNFKVFTAEEIEALPDPKWLVQDLFWERSMVVVYGQPKSGKTHIVLRMLTCLAQGIPFASHAIDPKGFRLAYWAGEGVGGFGKRLRANKSYAGITQLPNLRIVSGAMNLVNPGSVEAFVESIRDFKPDGVVIDTYARAMPGSDEGTSETSLAVAAGDYIRSELSTAIVFVAHTGKDASRGIRGSNVLLSGLDVEIAVTKNLNGTITMAQTHSRESELAEPDTFELRKVEGSVVAVITNKPAGPAPDAPLGRLKGEPETLIMEILADMMPDGKPPVPGRGAAPTPPEGVPVRRVLIDDAREMYVKRAADATRATKVQQFKRALGRLREKGHVFSEDDVYVQLRVRGEGSL